MDFGQLPANIPWFLCGICAAFFHGRNQPDNLDDHCHYRVLFRHDAVFLPHMALGAELSTDYHERSRLFGVRHIFYILGSILSFGAMYLLINEEFSPDGNVRLLARDLAFVAIAIMVVLVIYAVVVLRERPEFQNRQQGGPLQAFRDIWGNPNARLLITVTFIENVGSAAIAALTLYISQYVVGAPAMAPLIILAYMIQSSLFVPMWIPLSKRYGKIKVWMAGMVMTGVSFGGMFVLPFLDTLDERLMVIIVLAFFAGLANGCGGTLGPSVQGDVIDFDEYQTGERKEGSYFAAWNFVYKSALGVMLLLTCFVLDFAGFVPNQEQTMQVKLAMVSLYGLFPLVCYTIGAILFSRFKLDEEAYEVIRTELDARRAKEAATAQ